MDGAQPISCTRCAELEREVQSLKAMVAALQAEVQRLQQELAAARKNSGNSSKPPSSDIVKPPPPRIDRRRKKRRRGGQPGHPRHERPLFAPEQIDFRRNYTRDHCPDCGSTLDPSDAPPRVIQQVELVERPFRVTEHRGLAHWCPACEQMHYGRIPQPVRAAGLLGPRLTALVAYLKSVGHASFTTIHDLFSDVFGLPISRGHLAKVVQKVSASLEAPYEELLDAVPVEPRLNVDETGHPDQGQRLWTWCFRAELYTLFRVDPSRGSDVLLDVLGTEFNGVLGCDYFSAYRKFMKDCSVEVQFCLAHLIRDVKFLAEHPSRANRRYGRLLLDHLKKLFGVIHRRDEYASEDTFRRALQAVRNALVSDAILEVAETREAGNLSERFVEHFESYFRFITTPGVEPTNNLAEQAIRFVAIHRRMTQGTRGERGQRWWERICTVVATCRQQARSVFEFLHEAVQAHFRGQPAPSLLNNTS